VISQGGQGIGINHEAKKNSDKPSGVCQDFVPLALAL